MADSLLLEQQAPAFISQLCGTFHQRVTQGISSALRDGIDTIVQLPVDGRKCPFVRLEFRSQRFAVAPAHLAGSLDHLLNDHRMFTRLPEQRDNGFFKCVRGQAPHRAARCCGLSHD